MNGGYIKMSCKRLYLLRGCPGSGKSTLISKLGLEEYTISTDKIRLKIAGTEVIDGIEMISQKKNYIVFNMVKNCIITNMTKGLPIILDATNISDTGKYYKLANEYGYEVVVVDFKVSLEVLLERNKYRGIAYVPESVICKMYEKKKTTPIHEGSRVIRPSDMEGDWNDCISFLNKNNE